MIEIKFKLFMETEKAWKVSDDGNEHRAVWLPKSQCTVTKEEGDYITLEVPEWLAQKNNLI